MLTQITEAEWRAEGVRRFGADEMRWRFVCPACGHVASTEDWKAAGADPGEVAYSCVGRHRLNPREAFAKGPGPCNYAGGGLFGLNPQAVVSESGTHRVFAFADA